MSEQNDQKQRETARQEQHAKARGRATPGRSPSEIEDIGAVHTTPSTRVEVLGVEFGGVTADNVSFVTELNAIPPRPGMTNRWVRVYRSGAGSEIDTGNLQAASRAGWVPVDADSVEGGVVPSQRFGDRRVIATKDAMLMERPIKLSEVERARLAQLNNRMKAAEREEAMSKARELEHSGPFRDFAYENTDRRSRNIHIAR